MYKYLLNSQISCIINNWKYAKFSLKILYKYTFDPKFPIYLIKIFDNRK